MVTVLIIDDDTDIVLAGQMALEYAGHKVVSSRNTTIGRQMLVKHRPDILVLDVMMDSPTEGFEFAKQLRTQTSDPDLAAYRDIPILMLSSVYNATPLAAETEIANLPVELFVDKPIDPNDLIAKVAWIIESQ